MRFEVAAVRKCLKSFDFKTLFREHLGWDNHQARLDVPVDGHTFGLTAVAQKHGFVAFVCHEIPDRTTRLKIDHKVTKSVREHFVIYANEAAGQQVWHWVRREPGKPLASRDHRFDVSQSGDPLIQRLNQIAVSLDEEEKITVVDVVGRARAAFDVDRVTKRFYDRFKAEHAAFLKLIKGIKSDEDLQWYTSLMLNRLMFVYFIQKKGFLDGDTNYLRNRLEMVRGTNGENKFHSFYRYFLLRLFHEGLGTSPNERKLDPTLERLLGNVPFLNGGFFEIHELEERWDAIDIPDRAFEKLFDFFDQYSWHLDERPLRTDNEINPDVVGYIFEKYVNQKQMGAYYTKEDITEYISKNTVVPFLFDAARKECAIAFKPVSALWRLLRDDPDRYVYPAVRHGVIDDNGDVIQLPKAIEAGVRDVRRRDRWNRPAVDPYALPTETWREHVVRRQRCLEIREKLRAGDIHEIDELVTLNLDLWQLARDAIIHCEGPELLRAFWHAIEKITVLDPTCGSGAFLFAALRILETLYSDCLERMERFVEDLAEKQHHPEQFSDFKKVLDQIGRHPNARYFILKSIIVKNLFGVDIMEEAVEICKLRLFLKLVAQVETVEHVEPLPDVDFNVRVGNTLVGYPTADQVRQAFHEERVGDAVQRKILLGSAGEDYRRFEDDLELVEQAFTAFRTQQTTCGARITHRDKRALRGRLQTLTDQLDHFLASDYGVSPQRPQDLKTWKATHQPFHWLAEFYGIMRKGGFDVIIGNPPYVELRALAEYRVRNFSCERAGNLYALVLERCAGLVAPYGYQGFIVPVSSISTDRYQPLQRLLVTRSLHYSSFDDRPSRLFDGLEHIRLTIHILGPTVPDPRFFSTRYNKWNGEERARLFEGLRFARSERTLIDGALPKLCSTTERDLVRKLAAQRKVLSSFYAERGKHVVYYSRKVGYFLQVLDFQPRVLDGGGSLRPPSEFKELRFASRDHARLALCCLNSSLFYWFVTVFSDCRHVNKREVDAFPVDLEVLSSGRSASELLDLGRGLMTDLKTYSQHREMRFLHDTLTVQCIFPKRSKHILDKIDRILAGHYDLTDEEVDFIINYDIKYRMGGDAGGEED